MVVGIEIRVIPHTPITAICAMIATKMTTRPMMIVFIRLRWLNSSKIKSTHILVVVIFFYVLVTLFY